MWTRLAQTDTLQPRQHLPVETTATMKLYITPGSPYARMARIDGGQHDRMPGYCHDTQQRDDDKP